MTTQIERKQRQQKIKETIKMINDTVCATIKPSEIHGVGVFAIRDIKKGERIYVDGLPQMVDVPYKEFKNIRPEIVEIILQRFPLVKTDNSQFLVHETLLQMYLNHSDNPNWDNKTGKALRKIKAGEEITEDYRNIKDYQKVYEWLK